LGQEPNMYKYFGIGTCCPWRLMLNYRWSLIIVA